MKCLHCLVDFHPSHTAYHVGSDRDEQWFIYMFQCPACQLLNLYLANQLGPQPQDPVTGEFFSFIPIRPMGSSRPPCPPEVSSELAEDYREACAVLPYSSKASAALSRRCLQNLLRTKANVKHSDLEKEIQEVINSGILPSHLTESIDAIRQIGNFAAHPTKSKSSGDIVPVEPHEAEWNLDVLEGLFDFFYVQPARTAKRRDALNAKLIDAGKPPLK